MPLPSTRAVVVLVEPEADCRQMYAKCLSYRGFLPVPVSTASDALLVGHKADVIITGLLLPGAMDGVELIARLRSAERTARVPIVVLTVCAWRTERKRALEAGCDVFLAKPCLPKVLVSIIRRLLSHRRVQRRACVTRRCVPRRRHAS